jgi:hypothetical protein
LGGVNRGTKGVKVIARKLPLKRDIITKIGLNTGKKKKRFRAIFMPQRSNIIFFWPPKLKYPLINTTVLYFTATVVYCYCTTTSTPIIILL